MQNRFYTLRHIIKERKQTCVEVTTTERLQDAGHGPHVEQETKLSDGHGDQAEQKDRGGDGFHE